MSHAARQLPSWLIFDVSQIRMLDRWFRKRALPAQFDPQGGADVKATIAARRKFFAQCQCCFCGEAIDMAVGLELIVAYEDDSKQQFFAHAVCFKSRAHPSAGKYVDGQPKSPSVEEDASEDFDERKRG